MLRRRTPIRSVPSAWTLSVLLPLGNASPAGHGWAGDALLVQISRPDGPRLEWVLPPGARRAALLLGPVLGTPWESGLALDPLRAQGLALDASGLGDLRIGEASALAGLAAQVRFVRADGQGAFTNAVDLGPPAAQVPGEPTGQVVIREFLADPRQVPDAEGEWIEVVNVAPVRLDLSGWSLGDGRADFHRLAPEGGPLWIGPGERLVLANQGDPTRNGGLRPDYVYSNLVLANAGDSIELRDRGGLLVDAVRYEARTWPVRPGRSSALLRSRTDARSNDDPGNWYLTERALPRVGPPGSEDADGRAP